MIRLLVIVALCCAGCACSKQAASPDAKCEKARDRYLVDAERKGKDAIAAIPAERRATFEVELTKELGQIRARFVEACVKTGFDVTCLDDPPADEAARQAKGKQCKEMFAPMAKLIYIERDEPPAPPAGSGN